MTNIEDALLSLYDIINDGHRLRMPREVQMRLIHVVGVLEQCLLDEANRRVSSELPKLPFEQAPRK